MNKQQLAAKIWASANKMWSKIEANEYIQEKVRELNLRPRKCLEFKTPFEVYFSKTLHLT